MSEEQLKISDLNLPTLDDIELPLKVKELINLLSKSEVETYLIGGFVRDMVLGNKSLDLDFVVVDKSAIDVAAKIISKIEGNYFLLDEETKTTRVVLKDEMCVNYTFDFTSVAKSKLEDDFLRRDFTFNALAINLQKPDVLIDKFSGLNDLKNKNIKAIKLTNLTDDPLRFIRAFRFAVLLQGCIDKEVLDYIKKNLNQFNSSVSGERIAVELWKILDNDNSFEYMKLMSEVGLLEKIFPELTPMRKVTPNDYHHLWLFDHSVELIKTAEENFSKLPGWAKEELSSSFGHLESPKRKAIVKLGCVFHDVGKPGTWEIKNINGAEKHTFYGHDKLGADIVSKIAERLKFSNAITDLLTKLVRHHLRPFQLSQGNAPISERALYRFFREVGDDIPPLLMLVISDLYATLGPKVTKESLLDGEKLILFLFDEYKKYKAREIEIARKPKLLDGNEIMSITGLKPSPKLGSLMKELDEAIALREITTKDGAQKWVLDRIKK